jgi:hypothetical protein
MLAALAAALLALPGLAQGTQPDSQKSLADLARDATKNKPAPAPGTKVWTNDNIPTNTAIGAAGPAAPTPAVSGGDESAAAPAEAGPRSPEELKQLETEWRAKIQGQKDQIALLERELEVSKRENQIRATTYYADAGNRMRYENQAKYAADDRKYQAETADKQKQLDAAKQKLEDMREQLRKAGLPSSWGD